MCWRKENIRRRTGEKNEGERERERERNQPILVW
jgi:hypothetical protein